MPLVTGVKLVHRLVSRAGGVSVSSSGMAPIALK